MKKLFLLKSLLLLCALIVGTNAWADGPVVIYSETFGSPASNTDISSFTGWSATASMFNLTGTETVASCYSGNKVGKGDASTTTNYTAASGNGNAFQQGTANTTTTILTVQKINISGKTSLSFNAGLRNGGAATYIKVYYQIDNGTKTEITLTGYGATTGWHYVSGSISGTGTNLKLFFEQTPTRGWTSRIDDIKVTGVSGGGSTVITPTISPASGAVASGTEVTITCDTEGASIYYTTNGNTPSSSSTPYNPSSKPTITAATTIKAIGIKDGLTDSEVATASYTIATPCATPTFSVAAGAYTEAKSVEIACATEGATIHYTTDGTVPTSSSPTYSSALSVRTDKTIKAIAIKDGYANSNIAEASYTFYVELPFEWDGGTATDIQKLSGVTGNSLADYAAAHAPYRIQFNSTSDYIQIKTNAQPGKVYVDVKMIGGATTSKIKIQESADGSAFTDVEEFTISGSQDDIHNFATTKMFKATSRYVRIIKSLHANGGNIGVGPIKITDCTTASVTAYQWSTYVSDKALDFTDSDIKAYVVTGASGSAITKTQVYEVAANTPLLLNAPAATYAIPVATDGTDYSSSNKLVAGTGAAVAYDANSGYNYVLAVDNGKAMFMRIVDGTPATVPSGKAYLALDAAPSGARGLNLFDDEDVTGIDATLVNSEKVNSDVFDLSGRKVANPTKGLYIVNGKKYVIK